MIIDITVIMIIIMIMLAKDINSYLNYGDGYNDSLTIMIMIISIVIMM